MEPLDPARRPKEVLCRREVPSLSRDAAERELDAVLEPA
jgi:hypothetical protein